LWLKVVSEGEIAPDFTLQTDEGSQISLSDYKGKTVVLYFYPKDETPGCTTEALGFSEAAGKFEKEGAVIIGVSKDSVESHQKFKKKHGLPFTLLSDPEGKVLKLYNVWKQKNLYGRTFMGTERTTFVIDGMGKVQKVYQKFTPQNHAQTCLADLKTTPKLADLKLS
jgi:peroxiredoxin